MDAETIELTLPISQKKVVIRNYTTRGDDAVAEQLLYAGIDGSMNSGSEDGFKVVFPMSNVTASQNSYVPRLVQSINGNSAAIEKQLEDLRSEDYEAIDTAVSKIVGEHSPKAKAAKKSSQNATAAK